MNNKETINKMYHQLKMSVVDIAKALQIDVQTVVESIEVNKITC
jgi:TATA-box binding protein (TBP) (component of TFIID and TFIIIB)